MTLQEKQKSLEKMLSEMTGAVVAFSGGVDSTLLLAEACKILGNRTLAVICQSPAFPQSEFEEAVQLADRIGANWTIVQTTEFNDLEFRKNPFNRCFLCKKLMFEAIKKIAHQEKLIQVIEGSNKDDESDYRPGLKAIREMGIRSPLMEVELTKREIRILAEEMNLANWDKPAAACLYSRLPYGSLITKERLSRVERSEDFLKSRGITQVRVRDYENTARIEVAVDDIHKICSANLRNEIINALKQIGYQYVTLDLEGYRTGSMNEVLQVIK